MWVVSSRVEVFMEVVGASRGGDGCSERSRKKRPGVVGWLALVLLCF